MNPHEAARLLFVLTVYLLRGSRQRPDLATMDRVNVVIDRLRT